MRETMLIALLVSLGMGHGADVPPAKPTPVAVRTNQATFSEIPTVRLLIRGGTAQWAFQFACVGAHCQFRHSHVLHRFRRAQYVNFAVRFTGITDHRSDAAIWLQRASAKRESAEGN